MSGAAPTGPDIAKAALVEDGRPDLAAQITQCTDEDCGCGGVPWWLGFNVRAADDDCVTRAFVLAHQFMGHDARLVVHPPEDGGAALICPCDCRCVCEDCQ